MKKVMKQEIWKQYQTNKVQPQFLVDSEIEEDVDQIERKPRNGEDQDHSHKKPGNWEKCENCDDCNIVKTKTTI